MNLRLRLMNEKTLRVRLYPNQTDYRELWQSQESFREGVIAGADDILLLTEHRPVITLGRGGGEDHFLTDPKRLQILGYDVVQTSRGGDITCHLPGQLVSYPIFDLRRHYLDVHRFLRDLEEVSIRLLREHSIDGFRVEGKTGVWTARGKVAAIGIHTRRWVSIHGMAFNVRNNLEGFAHIIPCGLEDRRITSLEELTGREADWGAVVEATIRHYREVFGFQTVKEDLS